MRRILLLEDDHMLRMTIADWLGTEHEVTEAGDVKSAKAVIDNLPKDPAIDLLISDYQLPDGRGTEIAAHVRQRFPHLPVLYITGSVESLKVDPLFRQSPAPFLEKPYHLEALDKAIKQLLAARL